MNTHSSTKSAAQADTAVVVTAKGDTSAIAIIPALLGKDAIKTEQDGIRGSLLKLDMAVHANAIQCLLHAEKHNDPSLFRRLLVEVLDTKSGYRRQGLINWMRKHSPLELKGDTINMGGLDKMGNKRPFLIQEAANTPFWNDAANNERVAKPVFQSAILNPVDRAIKTMQDSLENTVNGKPVDPSKPYYDGIESDKVVNFLAKVKELRGELPADSTEEVRKVQARAAADQAFLAQAAG